MPILELLCGIGISNRFIGLSFIESIALQHQAVDFLRSDSATDHIDFVYTAVHGLGARVVFSAPKIGDDLVKLPAQEIRQPGVQELLRSGVLALDGILFLFLDSSSTP